MSIAKKVLDFGSLKSAVADVANEYRRANEELESLKRRREDTANAAAHREDVVAFTAKWVDNLAARYRGTLTERLTSLARRDPAEAPEHLTRDLLSLAPSSGARGPEGVSPGLFAMVFGDQLKEMMRAAVLALPIEGEGLPQKQRKSELTRLDQQIAETEAQLTQLRNEAAKAGIRLDARSGR